MKAGVEPHTFDGGMLCHLLHFRPGTHLQTPVLNLQRLDEIAAQHFLGRFWDKGFNAERGEIPIQQLHTRCALDWRICRPRPGHMFECELRLPGLVVELRTRTARLKFVMRIAHVSGT